MRILLLDADLNYLNPTRTLLMRLISLCGEAVCFGPGYVSSETLRKGLRSFVDKNGPFDIALATEHILFAFDYVGSVVDKSYLKNYDFQFPVEDLNMRQKLLSEFRVLPIKKVACLLESDFYNFTNSQLDNLEKSADFFIGWDDVFIESIENLNNLNKESFFKKCNDNYLNFVIQNRQRMIPILHFVADNEFCFTDLVHRPNDWFVPGVSYSARKEAKYYLANTKGIILERDSLLPLSSILSRLGLKPLSWTFYLEYRKIKFRKKIMQSKFVFTCGSGLDYPVRKFFEIPALGSVMVCQPCKGFSNLGFEDGVNALVCEPKNLPEIHERIITNLDVSQIIASAGRDLIGHKHTIHVRAAQIKSALEKVVDSTWWGARWHKGTMVHSLKNLS